MFDALLDLSVFFSFDKSGFVRHRKHFKKDDWRQGGNLKALITGASSGIGLSLARSLLSLGVSLHITYRNREKGLKAIEALQMEFPKSRLSFSPLELSSLQDIPHFEEPFDILVHNAGGMPTQKVPATERYEHIFASHVIGPYNLTRLLISKNKLKKNGRVIFVSSGGMYLKALSLDDLNFVKSPYNPYKAYANAKRAQVDLTALFAERFGSDFLFSAMHPGWVDTPGVRQFMPLFYQRMKNRLRTPEEGADTALFLAMTNAVYPSGRFWFDRKEASSAWLPFTKTCAQKREALWSLCESEYEREFCR